MSVWTESELSQHIGAAKAALLTRSSGVASYTVGAQTFAFDSFEALEKHLDWLGRKLAEVKGTGGLRFTRARIRR
jgi:hypothetical protein